MTGQLTVHAEIVLGRLRVGLPGDLISTPARRLKFRVRTLHPHPFAMAHKRPLPTDGR